jgi:Protein of unknown function (DUF2281)
MIRCLVWLVIYNCENHDLQQPTIPMIAQPSDLATAPTLLEGIRAKVQALPPERQQQVLDFVEFLAQKNQPPEEKKTIWEDIDELMAEVPDEEWDQVPTDGSYQHDHYLYGTPKRPL